MSITEALQGPHVVWGEEANTIIIPSFFFSTWTQYDLSIYTKFFVFYISLFLSCIPPILPRPQPRCQSPPRSHQKTQLGKDPLPSLLKWLSVGLSSLWLFGLRASVPCWLSGGGHPQACEAYHNMTTCFTKVIEGEGLLTRQKLQLYIKHNYGRDIPLLLPFSAD